MTGITAKTTSKMTKVGMIFDILVVTHTSDNEVCDWMQDKVRDSSGDAEWITCAVFSDEKIIDSVLKPHDSQDNSSETMEEEA